MNKNIRLMSELNLVKGKIKKLKLTHIVIFLLFEFIFTVCTFPFILLYGPFENAKSTYVGAAMKSVNHKYLATWFLSDKEIADILEKSSSETGDETTNINEMKTSNDKDDRIEN